jgi:hypothetical protein
VERAVLLVAVSIIHFYVIRDDRVRLVNRSIRNDVAHWTSQSFPLMISPLTTFGIPDALGIELLGEP